MTLFRNGYATDWGRRGYHCGRTRRWVEGKLREKKTVYVVNLAVQDRINHVSKVMHLTCPTDRIQSDHQGRCFVHFVLHFEGKRTGCKRCTLHPLCLVIEDYSELWCWRHYPQQMQAIKVENGPIAVESRSKWQSAKKRNMVRSYVSPRNRTCVILPPLTVQVDLAKAPFGHYRSLLTIEYIIPKSTEYNT